MLAFRRSACPGAGSSSRRMCGYPQLRIRTPSLFGTHLMMHTLSLRGQHVLWQWLAIPSPLFVRAVVLAVALLAFGAPGLPRNASAQNASTRSTESLPNIVLIVADDLGIYDLGCYGRAEHRTPNLDRLAASGMRYTTAYCGLPICSASRAALMTSKFPSRLHLTTYLPGRPDAPSQKLLQPRIEPGLVPSEQTLAEVLKRSGYATGLFGKWHLGGGPSAPAEQGWDVVYEPAGNGDPATTGGKNEYAITDRAIEFIRQSGDRPYLCYVPHHSPHITLQETDASVARNSKAWNPLYAAAIESLDTAVGRLLDAIDASPRGRNTLVIMTSDNGGLHVPEGHPLPVTHNGPYRAGKGYLYEGGVRVPMMVRWPDRIRPSQTLDAPVWTLDVLPSVLEAAGLKTDRTVGPVDGQSLFTQWTGDAAATQSSERTFYWHLPHYTNQGSRPAGAIRRGRWKLIEDYESDTAELYDLESDIGERNDVSGQHPDRVAELRDALKQWRVRTAAQSNSPNPDFDPASHRGLYIDRDPSKLRGGESDASSIAESWKPWRQAMNRAVQNRAPQLKDAAKRILLPASASKTHGTKIRYEPETYKNVVGYWTEVDDWAEWEFESTHDGWMDLEIHAGCGSGNGGSDVEVTVSVAGEADQKFDWKVRETGHFQNIVIEPIGRVRLRPGAARVTVRPKKKAAVAVVDIRQIVLLPSPFAAP